MQRQERFQQDPRVVLSFVHCRWLSLQAKQSVDRCLSGADRILHSKHHIVREFAILPDKGEVLRAFRYDLGTIALASGKKVAGDEGHHARNACAGVEDSRSMRFDAQMANDLRHHFTSSAY